MNKSPCMYCKTKYEGCHDINKCDKYKEYRNKRDRINSKKAEEVAYKSYRADLFRRLS